MRVRYAAVREGRWRRFDACSAGTQATIFLNALAVKTVKFTTPNAHKTPSTIFPFEYLVRLSARPLGTGDAQPYRALPTRTHTHQSGHHRQCLSHNAD